MSVIWVSSIILEYCSVFFTHTELTETFPNDKNRPKSRVFLVILLPANMWGFLSVAQRLKHSELGKMWDVMLHEFQVSAIQCGMAAVNPTLRKV